MLGDGIVIFGTWPSELSRRKAKASLKMVSRRVILPSIAMAGGAYSHAPSSFLNCTCGASPPPSEMPPSWRMKSMCHECRRNSPSVASLRPTSCCSLTAPRIASSSAARSASASMVPALKSARAWVSAAGRRRLPTWSARNGGRVFSDMRWMLGSASARLVRDAAPGGLGRDLDRLAVAVRLDLGERVALRGLLDLELAPLDALVEPRGAEHQPPEPVHEGSLRGAAQLGPAVVDVLAQLGGRVLDLAVDGEVDQILQLLVLQAVGHEAELQRRLLAALTEVALVEGEAKLSVLQYEVLARFVVASAPLHERRHRTFGSCSAGWGERDVAPEGSVGRRNPQVGPGELALEERVVRRLEVAPAGRHVAEDPLEALAPARRARSRVAVDPGLHRVPRGGARLAGDDPHEHVVGVRVGPLALGRRPAVVDVQLGGADDAGLRGADLAERRPEDALELRILHARAQRRPRRGAGAQDALELVQRAQRRADHRAGN